MLDLVRKYIEQLDDKVHFINFNSKICLIKEDNYCR